jgi:hypothetical protein
MSVGPFTHLGRRGPKTRFRRPTRMAGSRRRLSAIIERLRRPDNDRTERSDHGSTSPRLIA